MTTTIRSMLSSDVGSILAIWNRALPRDPMDEHRFVRTVLADPDYWPGEDSGFFVAVVRDRPAGFLRAIIRRCPNDRLGLEPDEGWIPFFAVDPEHQRCGIGTALVWTALDYFARHRRKHAWVCGTTTSAPGSIVPGVDVEAYPAARALLEKQGFVVDQWAFSMARPLADFDVEAFRCAAGQSGPGIQVTTLSAECVQDFLLFLADALPGAWNIAARAKVHSGELHEILIALLDGRIVGYCQWSGEHFGPFGVAPGVRNQRVGAKLFTEAVCRIRQGGGQRVWFNWADENAKRFYDRFGLHVTRRYCILRQDLPA